MADARFTLLDPSRVSVAFGTSTFTVESSFGSQLGVNRIATTVYVAAFGQGVWRSSDDGATWVRIKPPLIDLRGNRTEFAVTPLGAGKTRMSYRRRLVFEVIERPHPPRSGSTETRLDGSTFHTQLKFKFEARGRKRS